MSDSGLPRSRSLSFARGFLSDPLTHWPFPTISRRLYGNLSGFRQNLYGSVDSQLHRLVGALGRSRSPTTVEIRAEAQNLRRTGLAIMNGWIPPSTVSKVRESMLEAATKIGTQPSAYIDIVEGQDFDIHTPEVFGIFNSRITDFLECYFGGPFLINSGAFRLTRHVPPNIRAKNEIYSDRWHTDSGPTSMLAIFVLLNDVAANSGPTSALNISATRKAVRNGYNSRNMDDPLIDAIEADPSRVEMTGPAGTIMFINVAKCLHRAGIPEVAQHREWLQFRLFPCYQTTDLSKLHPAKILKYTNPSNKN